MSDQIRLPFGDPEPQKGKGRGKGQKPPADAPPPPPESSAQPITPVALHEAARTRYLNYALSVITARALPDVRDGLKPVQRRILYAMLHNLHLTPDGRFRKSAAVVGEVMAKYHPHGDASIYDAMVRMAQTFSLRNPLVDGHGNFGSLDGDPPAAMRYTEAKLRPLAIELLDELKQNTVGFRPNYDGTLEEPVVLPARFPNLLVNGVTGIAVGMATNIPPHNLGEVLDACLALIDEPDLSIPELCAYVKGPDFPVGGQLLTSPEELIRIYEKGEGSVRVRGEYQPDPEDKDQLVITSIPYGVNKADLVSDIADHIVQGKIPQLLDVRDESTEQIRIVLELKKGTAPEVAMAYLFKHTVLESPFHFNMTCLVPTEKSEICAPQKVNLKELLRHFLDFRMEVLTRRLQYQLELIKKRIHILEGFERIFDELDEAIRIIRASEGKQDAAVKLMARFFLDEVQADAILETRLYRLAKLEIEAIRAELAELRAEEDRLYELLGSISLRWNMIRQELTELKTRHADPRRTKVGEPVKAVTFDPNAYVITEQAVVIVTRDGWIKRQKSFSDVSSIRVREGDGVGWVYPSTTRHTVAFFTSLGSAYVMRVDEFPATTGYGEPVQRHFQFGDRERVVGVICLDPRCLPTPVGPPEGSGSEDEGSDADDPVDTAGLEAEEEARTGLSCIAITRAGKGLRFPLDVHKEKSTKSGRRFIRLDDAFKDDAVVRVQVLAGDEHVALVTEEARALVFKATSLNLLRGSGKGVTAIKLQDEDRVLDFALGRSKTEGLAIKTSRGREVHVCPDTYNETSRGGKGTEIVKTGTIEVLPQPPVVVREKEEPKA